MTRLNYLLGMLVLSWAGVAALTVVFWMLGLADCRATMAAFALVTLVSVFWSESAYQHNVALNGSDDSDEAGA